MKLVISGGDSFTWGAELPDDQKEPSPYSWAHQVSKRFDARHINVSGSGRGNSFISRRIINKVIESLETYSNDDIFVQIMWTFVQRREVKILDGTFTDHSPLIVDLNWFPLDAHCAVDESKLEFWKDFDLNDRHVKSVRNTCKKRYKQYKSIGVVDFATNWYKFVDTSTDDVYISLKEIILVQEFLKNRNIKYIFTHCNSHVIHDLYHYDDPKSEDNQFLRNLSKNIDSSRWFYFPENLGFDNWAKDNGYSYATSHPLEKAHEDAASLIYDFINQLYG